MPHYVAMIPARLGSKRIKKKNLRMLGDKPLYSAFVTTGKDGWETPKGTWHILYRVADETMTSAAIGAEE